MLSPGGSSSNVLPGPVLPGPVLPGRALASLGLAAYLYALARGLNPMCSYAYGHWLLTWNHGFIKRGLVGTLLHPVIAGRPPADIHLLVTVLASVGLAASSVLLLRASYRIATSGASWGFPLLVLAFLSSSGVILEASTLGFFDHLLLLLTLLCVDQVARGRFAVVSALTVLALGIHEIFALYGLPVIVFAAALKLRGWPPRTVWRWAIPPVAFLAFVTFAQGSIPAARILALRAELTDLHCLTPNQVTNAVFHLENGFRENVAAQDGKILRHLLDPKINRVAWPMIIALLVAASASLHSALRSAVRTAADAPGRAAHLGLQALLFACALAPLLAHVFAWDATRFTNFVVMQSLALLYTIIRVGEARPIPRTASTVVLVLSAAALAATFVWSTPLMTGYVDGKGLIDLR